MKGPLASHELIMYRAYQKYFVENYGVTFTQRTVNVMLTSDLSQTNVSESKTESSLD